MLAEAIDNRPAVVPTDVELHALIEAATRAPSPDNNQPWLFEQRPDGEILLYHDVHRALPSDVNGMFSMIALGAALENLCIAGKQNGWEPHVHYLVGSEVDATDREMVARVRFCVGGAPDPLYPWIARRHTCRKPFSRQPVADDALREMEASLALFPGLQLHWIADRPRLRALAGLVAATDRIRFEYPAFHAELYRQLRFTPEEAAATRDGLDVRCLELPPGGAAMLRFLRKWSRMRWLNRFGLSRLLSVSSAVQVRRSGTVGLLTTEDGSRNGYLRAGQLLQRVWLIATRLHLGFHPLGSLPIFLSRLARPDDHSLAPAHTVALARTADQFHALYPLAQNQGLVLLFRLGTCSDAVVRSIRRPAPEVIGHAH